MQEEVDVTHGDTFSVWVWLSCDVKCWFLTDLILSQWGAHFCPNNLRVVSIQQFVCLWPAGGDVGRRSSVGRKHPTAASVCRANADSTTQWCQNFDQHIVCLYGVFRSISTKYKFFCLSENLDFWTWSKCQIDIKCLSVAMELYANVS